MREMKKFNNFLILGRLGFLLIFVLMGLRFFYMMISKGNTNYFMVDKIELIISVLAIASFISMFIGTVLPYILRDRKDELLSKTGILTFGKILSVQNTGVRINGEAEFAITLEFILPSGKKVNTECIMIIPALKLGNFASETIVPLRYDQENPESIVLDFSVDQITLQKAYNQYLYDNGQLTKELLKVAQAGETGQAVVLENTPTGRIIDGKSELALNLLVTKADSQQYQTKQVKAVRGENIAQLAVGMVVNVRYSPTNPDLLVIKMIAGNAANVNTFC